MLEIHPLEAFRLGATTLTSSRLEELRANTAWLEEQNAEQHRLVEVLAERRRLADEKKRAEDAARLVRVKGDRETQAAAIRTALRGPAPWNDEHPAVALIETYVRGREVRDLGGPSRREQWKCIAFFSHVAARQDVLFGPKEIASTLREHGVRLEKGIYKVIGRWLHELVDREFLFEIRGDDGYSLYKATYAGLWW